jgi:hypothetical protein
VRGRTLRRHARILGYVRGSLARRWRKNAAVVVVYGLTIFALAAAVFQTEALIDEAVGRLGGSPELSVQGLSAGRHGLVPVAELAALTRITGVRGGESRLWAYHPDPVTGESLLLMVPAGTPLGDGEARAGSELMRRRGIEPGGKLLLRDASGENRSLTLSAPTERRGAQESAALIQVSEGAFRALTGMPEGFATDLVLRVRNPRELATIARKIVRSHPAARPVVRDELVRTYASVYHWRAGVIIALLLVPVLAFVLFAWDKAAGLSPEERREIGILKAIGWETGEVLLLKCYEGMAVSVAAFGMGALLAALAGALARLPAVSALAGWSVLYPTVPPSLAVGPFQVATLFFLTVVPYLVATVIPAWRAATIDPDLVMRG